MNLFDACENLFHLIFLFSGESLVIFVVIDSNPSFEVANSFLGGHLTRLILLVPTEDVEPRLLGTT